MVLKVAVHRSNLFQFVYRYFCYLFNWWNRVITLGTAIRTTFSCHAKIGGYWFNNRVCPLIVSPMVAYLWFADRLKMKKERWGT